MADPNTQGISFSNLIKAYETKQEAATKRLESLASNISQASPGQFLLAQFWMSQVTQIGDSISNMIAQVNSIINRSIQNQRAQ